jgi:glutathione S-transferase
MERYRLQEWLNFITSEMHKGIGGLFNPAMTADFKPSVLAGIDKRLAWVDEQLKGRDYLMGSQFTVADAYLFTVLRWTVFLKISLEKFAQIRAYMSRVEARPKVQEALVAEGLKK